MQTDEILEKLREYKAEKADVYGIEVLGLFGSCARGEQFPDSDIDLLVLLDNDHPTLADENVVRTPLCELEIKTGVSINPYIISRKSWENRPFKTPFYVNVINEGVIL